ncbi:MAG: hypothetical protein LUD79_01105 [Oscillospiraceae bacterium]|nr:hypothetical protein [Oscillospiraceae bacterium]
MLIQSRKRVLLTHSLLNSWLYQYKAPDSDGAHGSFMQTLRRDPTETTEAMQRGIDFENLVGGWVGGNRAVPEEHSKWAGAIETIGTILEGAALQAALYRDLVVEGQPILLYGRLDGLKAGIIYDIKFTGKYETGKFTDSPQHPVYMTLCPEARAFVYLITDGTDVFTESFTQAETPPLEPLVQEFFEYLDAASLMDVYLEKWAAK